MQQARVVRRPGFRDSKTGAGTLDLFANRQEF